MYFLLKPVANVMCISEVAMFTAIAASGALQNVHTCAICY